MSKLPQISGRECIKVLEKIGFYFMRQRGSHIILCRDEPFTLVVVPDHKELDKGTIKIAKAKIRNNELWNQLNLNT